MTTGFIINPPIKDDRDYYRNDQRLVDAVLSAARLRVEGLRRSGKTSFLKRVERAAIRAEKRSLFLDLLDLAGERDFEEAIAKIADEPAESIILIDELENSLHWPASQLVALINQLLRRSHVVVTAAPSLDPDRCSVPESVHRLMEALELHTIGALTEIEARNLVTQSQRGALSSPLTEAQIGEILDTKDRLPLVLQALGEAAVGGNSLASSLATFGTRVLSGLNVGAAEILAKAAHGQSVSAGIDADRLVALGALVSSGISGLAIRGRHLRQYVGYASPQPNGIVVASKVWVRHARILHLSDPHFGPQHAEANQPEKTLSTLLEALEHQALPDFIAVTGDLTWSGDPAELRIAEKFLTGLANWLGGKLNLTQVEARRRILVTPGNHEAAWSLSEGLEGLPDDRKEAWVGYCLAPFFNMVHRFYAGILIWDIDCPCIEITFDKPSVSFLLLSSCYGLTKSEKRGYFGDPVVKRANSLLNEKHVTDARFRLGLWHHNLREFQQDGRVLRNVDQSVALFVQPMPGLDMALHGHVHMGEVGKVHPRGDLRPLPYSAVGSFGVRADHRPGDSTRGRHPNQFSFLDLETSGDERRATTQYFELRIDAHSKWNWEPSAKQPPISL